MSKHQGPEHKHSEPAGAAAPHSHGYRVLVDRQQLVFEESVATGRQILERAGKTPPERWLLYQRLKGNQRRKVGLDETVDLSAPAVERFLTLPRDQTEGIGAA